MVSPDGSDAAGADEQAVNLPDPAEFEEVVYSPESELRHPRKLFHSIFHDLFAGRELGWRLFLRNIRSMYRQTLLGLFWAFLPPLANTAIWVFLNSKGVLNFDDQVHGNYLVFVLTGMVLWQAFIDSFQMPMNIVKSNKSMISRLRFPRESLLIVGWGEILFNLAIRLIGLAAVLAWFGIFPGWNLIPATFGLLVMILLATGLGLLLTPVATLYHDISRFLIMAIPFWMILTPVVYAPLDGMPASLLNWLNPASPLLIVSRDLLLIGSTEYLTAALIWGAISIPLVLVGLVVFRVALPVLIERMSA